MRRSLLTPFIFAAIVALCVATSATAQMPGPRRRQMSPEEAKAVWALQATHVASKLDLSEEQTTKLVGTYINVREGYATAIRERIQEAMASADAGDRQARRRAMMEARQNVAKAQREKLHKALSDLLDEKKTKQTVQRLGTFNWQWDRMVHVMAGFKLGDKQAEALELVNKYVIESTAAQRKAMDGGDIESLRTVSTEHRAKLDEKLKEILSEEQMGKWTESTAIRRRPGRGPRSE